MCTLGGGVGREKKNMNKNKNNKKICLTSLKQLSTAADTKDMPKDGCSESNSGMRAKSLRMAANLLLEK